MLNKRGFIFSLDMMMAVYLTLISVVVVVSAYEVLSQINFDDIIMVQYGDDFRNLDFYSPALISGTCDSKKFYGFSESCVGNRIVYSLYHIKYRSVTSGEPNLWFMAGSSTSHVYKESGPTICFGEY